MLWLLCNSCSASWLKGSEANHHMTHQWGTLAQYLYWLSMSLGKAVMDLSAPFQRPHPGVGLLFKSSSLDRKWLIVFYHVSQQIFTTDLSILQCPMLTTALNNTAINVSHSTAANDKVKLELKLHRFMADSSGISKRESCILPKSQHWSHSLYCSCTTTQNGVALFINIIFSFDLLTFQDNVPGGWYNPLDGLQSHLKMKVHDLVLGWAFLCEFFQGLF